MASAVQLSKLKTGDVLHKNGVGRFTVVKVNRTTVDVRGENGNVVRAYPAIFDRKLNEAGATQ